MQFQITNFGVSVLNSATGPVELSAYELGSAYNYTPAPTDTNIHGSLLFTSTLTSAVVVNANVVKYSAFMDYSVGPFQFGEMGLFYQGQLFALGSNGTLITKNTASEADGGNSMRIDIYLSVVGTNYLMWLNLVESDNQLHVAVLATVDALPPVAQAQPNAYIIQPPNSQQTASIAYTDGVGLWNLDVYQYSGGMTATVVGYTSMSVSIALSQYQAAMGPEYLGQVVLEFTSGALYSICRYINTVVQVGSTVTLGFVTPIAMAPAVGDSIVVFNRVPPATTEETIPIATTTTLGGIIVGTGLTISPSGVLSIGADVVTSINGESGDVLISAATLPGLNSFVIDEGTF